MTPSDSAIMSMLGDPGEPKRKPRRFVRMFKPQFASLVETGQKLQTVRPLPKRRPVPGDIIDCREWTGNPYCSPQRKLKESEIIGVKQITINHFGITDRAGLWQNGEEFSRKDGFKDFEEMCAWFDKTHGLPFTGIVIVWKP